MALLRHPDHLINLSLHALGNYLSALVDDYIENSCNIDDICLYLGSLKESVPKSLANKVTEKLLWTLDTKLTDIDENLSRLFDVIILPSVTRLEFFVDMVHQVPGKVFNYHWNSPIIPEVLQRVYALTDLKVLRIFPAFEGTYIFPNSLIEFTCQNSCNDATLKQVLESCKGLKKLDMYNSTSIGDSSIAFIVEFKSLEHIDLGGTYINEEGMTELLQKLSSQLKSFGCTNLTTKQFEFLIQNYPQLTSLKFETNTGCEFKLFENLKFLKSFTITNVSPEDLEKILDAVGSQLILFHFGSSEPFDLRSLAAKCIAVECLHINSLSHNIIVPNVKEMKKLPGLKAVRCLCANFYYKPEAVVALISACQNIQIMEVNSDSDVRIIADAIVQNSMMSLKELNWWCTCDVKDSLLKIVMHCPNLEILRGFYVWRKHGNIKNDIRADRKFDYQRLL